MKEFDIISGDAVFTTAVHVTLTQKQIARLSSQDAGLLQIEEFKSFKTDTKASALKRRRPWQMQKHRTKRTLISLRTLMILGLYPGKGYRCNLLQKCVDSSIRPSDKEDSDHRVYASQNGEIMSILKQLKETVKMVKLVETQDKAKALPRPTRLPHWRDKSEPCQLGVKSEGQLEHKVSLQGGVKNFHFCMTGCQDTEESVEMQHNEKCKKVEVASVEEGQEGQEGQENEKMKLKAELEARRRGLSVGETQATKRTERATVSKLNEKRLKEATEN